jgi:hypothetical protein
VHAAVVGTAGSAVPFPVRSSVFNNMATAGETAMVPTVDLDGIVARSGAIDLLKVDSEGGEREILTGASAATLARIGDIKLEFHGSDREQIAQHLIEHGFSARVPPHAATAAWYGWFSANGAHR